MIPGFKLSRRDLELFGLGLATVGLLTALAQSSGITVERVLLIDVLPVILVIASIFYGLKIQDFVGGDFARYMSLIAVGLGSYGAVFHLVNLPYQATGHGVVFGLSSSFWLASTHAMQIFGLSIAAYGFYLLWRASG